MKKCYSDSCEQSTGKDAYTMKLFLLSLFLIACVGFFAKEAEGFGLAVSGLGKLAKIGNKLYRPGKEMSDNADESKNNKNNEKNEKNKKNKKKKH